MDWGWDGGGGVADRKKSEWCEGEAEGWREGEEHGGWMDGRMSGANVLSVNDK